MLQLDPSTITTISAEAKTERMTTFRILRRLVVKNTIDTVLIGRRKHYFPKHPESLLSFYDEKMRTIEKKKTLLTATLPLLLSLYKHGGARPIISHCEGSVGFRTIYSKIIDFMWSHASLEKNVIHGNSNT
jgi:hypothetical protein